MTRDLHLVCWCNLYLCNLGGETEIQIKLQRLSRWVTYLSSSWWWWWWWWWQWLWWWRWWWWSGELPCTGERWTESYCDSACWKGPGHHHHHHHIYSSHHHHHHHHHQNTSPSHHHHHPDDYRNITWTGQSPTQLTSLTRTCSSSPTSSLEPRRSTRSPWLPTSSSSSSSSVSPSRLCWWFQVAATRTFRRIPGPRRRESIQQMRRHSVV